MLLILPAVLVFCAPADAPAQSPRGSAGIQSGSISIDFPVVFTQVTRNPVGDKGRSGPRLPGAIALGEEARLVLLACDSPPRVLTSRFHSACDPDVSIDGKRLLFAGKAAAGDDWNIFEMNLESLEARQVTRNAGECRSPIYTSSFYTITEKEPWEQIAYVSTHSGEANELDGSPATSLYTCKLDGSYLQRITYNLSSDFDPAIMADGRLLYSAWRRATFDNGVSGRLSLESINTDGSDRAMVVNPSSGVGRYQRSPCVTTTGQAVFVESDSLAWDGGGRLSAVSLRRPLHTFRPITQPGDGLYNFPSPLPDGRILVSWRPSDGSGSYGVYRLDPATGRREQVFDDPAFHEIQARSVSGRARPDGRSSVVSPEDQLGEFYCMSVYQTEFKDRTWLPAGSVKTLRVVEGLPARVTSTEASPRSRFPQLSARRILAEVPVKADGSFHLTVPANTPIQLQILDDRGLALRSCGWIWARNHQAQGCIGCHEDPELTPPNRVPDALKATADMADVPLERRIAVDFGVEIAPIIAAKCAPCHRAGDPAPDLHLVGSGTENAKIQQLYEALLARDGDEADTSGLGKYVHPGRARTSPLVWHIYGRNTAKPWDGAAARGVAKPIPDGKSASLTEAEKQMLVRWIDLGARPEARPETTKNVKSGPSR